MVSRSILALILSTTSVLASPTSFESVHQGTKEGQHSNLPREEVGVTNHPCGMGAILPADTYALNDYVFTPINAPRFFAIRQSLSFFDPEDFVKFHNATLCQLVIFMEPFSAVENIWDHQMFVIDGGRPVSKPENAGPYVDFPKFETVDIHRTETRTVPCALLADQAISHVHYNVEHLSVGAYLPCKEPGEL